MTRLAAGERRAALIDTASRTFCQGSYRGTTTAEIAREAGVSEPILYRHFASKRELYLACIEDMWIRVRAGWEDALAAEPDQSACLTAMGRSYQEQKAALSNLWVQALAEASEDPEIRKYLRRHLREVHRFVGGVIRRAQASGAFAADRDADAEAWMFISLGLLGAVGRWLGGLAEDDFERIRAARRRWLTGRD